MAIRQFSVGAREGSPGVGGASSCIEKKETYIPLKQALYARSSMRTMSDVKAYGGERQFHTMMMVQNHVKKDSVTRNEFKEMAFGIDYPKELISLRWLERR